MGKFVFNYPEALDDEGDKIEIISILDQINKFATVEDESIVFELPKVSERGMEQFAIIQVEVDDGQLKSHYLLDVHFYTSAVTTREE